MTIYRNCVAKSANNSKIDEKHTHITVNPLSSKVTNSNIFSPKSNNFAVYTGGSPRCTITRAYVLYTRSLAAHNSARKIYISGGRSRAASSSFAYIYVGSKVSHLLAPRSNPVNRRDVARFYEAHFVLARAADHHTTPPLYYRARALG